MALCVHTRNAIQLRNLCPLISNQIKKYHCKYQDNLLTLDSDALDHFTTQLMQRKSNKWETHRMKSNTKVEAAKIKFQVHPTTEIDLRLVNSILRDAFEADDKRDIKNVIDECVKSRTLPEMSVFLQAFAHFAHLGDKATVLKLIELSKLLDDATLTQYSYFKHYLAEVTWAKGNISEAISLFEEVYSNNIYLRRKIRSMLGSLLNESINGRSEAVLFLILNFAKRLGNKYKDFYLLACIWRCCVLSEWFTDQSIALDLLEHNENLRKTVMNHIPMIVYLSLTEHNTDIVYRILEVLMRCETKMEYARIVELLFDYRLNQEDLQGCTKIIQWCALHGITLAMFQREQYLNLLCTRPNTNETPNIDRAPPTYHFKF